MSGAIQERAPVGTLTSLDGARDANKLRRQAIASDVNHCVTVATHVYKGGVTTTELVP